MFAPLPVYDILGELRSALAAHPLVILQAPPGAGKSTILPLELMQEQWLEGRKILMLEPRRLAARSVAGRMADLLQQPVGQKVGFRVRFENKVTASTQIEVVTEGILTRMIQQDSALTGTGLVIFDEFHERSLHADLALVLCRQVQEILRSDLRILIMSATLDSAHLSALLGNAPVVTSEGRQHPIRFHYLPQENETSISQRMTRAITRAVRENEGDLLAFLPGAGEIHSVAEILQEQEPSFVVHTLYGDMNYNDQEKAISPDPQGRRKVILSTSIAETSLTIEGVKVVVDSGQSRVPRFDPRSGLTRLVTVTVTRDAADQRAGRAGRLGPGVCYRLWAEGLHGKLQPQREPEIVSADLAPLVLELAQWGVKDPLSLEWPTPPQAGAVKQAQELLRDLGALRDGVITDRGREMLRLPTHPRIAHLLMESKTWGIAPLAADVAALLEERDPLPREAGADLTLRVEALHRWRKNDRVNADRRQLEKIERLSVAWRKLLKVDAATSIPDAYAIGGLIASAYPERIARQMEKGRPLYRLGNGRKAALPAQDPLAHEPWLAAAHVDAGMNEGKIFLAAPVSTEDLAELAIQEEVLSWDEREGVLVAQQQTHISGLVLDTKPLRNIPREKVQAVLSEALRVNPQLLNWSEAVQGWQARVSSLRLWRPNEDWPDVSTAALISNLDEWLAASLDGVKNKNDFQRIDLMQLLPSVLPWALQQKMNELAPDSITVPTGSKIRLEYHEDGSLPILAVRVQEMFGLTETPTVNEGRTKVLLHLLSPAYRPVQVTQDLRSFWQNTYPEVRKDLRGRYPEHHWPEDPWTAEAVRGPKRKKPL